MDIRGMNNLIKEWAKVLSLDVNIDANFVEKLYETQLNPTNSEWKGYCKRNKLDNLSDFKLMHNEGNFLEREKIDHYKRTAEYLDDNLEKSIDHFSKVLPYMTEKINHELKVTLLPDGKTNFGPRPSLQLFSLKPEADPYETYLFLIHIYYHEISFMNYTEYCEECANNPNTPEKLKYLILMLIQNEGIGNYAVLDDVLGLRYENPNYSFQYFTYANQLNEQEQIAKSMGLLRQLFNELNEENFSDFQKKINAVLKNKQLPIINLVGTHMAKVIEEKYGIAVLKDVNNKKATEFFKLYLLTDDNLKEHLIRDDGFFSNLARQ